MKYVLSFPRIDRIRAKSTKSLLFIFLWRHYFLWNIVKICVQGTLANSEACVHKQTHRRLIYMLKGNWNFVLHMWMYLPSVRSGLSGMPMCERSLRAWKRKKSLICYCCHCSCHHSTIQAENLKTPIRPNPVDLTQAKNLVDVNKHFPQRICTQSSLFCTFIF